MIVSKKDTKNGTPVNFVEHEKTHNTQYAIFNNQVFLHNYSSEHQKKVLFNKKNICSI